MDWTNLHTHTWRCRHATGDVEDYARVAAAGGMRVLGMADHAPLPDGRWQDHRMDMDQLDGYVSAVRGCRVPGVEVLLGLECDWDPAYGAFYRDELLGRRGFDYLIAGCHFTPLGGSWIPSFDQLTSPAALRAYAGYAVATMESGLFRFLTHPDLFGVTNRWTEDAAACARDICQASATLGVPLELNSYGLRKGLVPSETGGRRAGYPWPPFWGVAAEAGAQVVLSSDAHRPEDLLAGIADLEAIRARFGLTRAVLPFVPERTVGGARTAATAG